MKKQIVATAKKHRINISAKPAISFEYKEELKQMTDKELLMHRRQLLKNRDGLSSEYWDRMWSVNSEMAMRFCKIIREEQEC